MYTKNVKNAEFYDNSQYFIDKAASKYYTFYIRSDSFIKESMYSGWGTTGTSYIKNLQTVTGLGFIRGLSVSC